MRLPACCLPARHCAVCTDTQQVRQVVHKVDQLLTSAGPETGLNPKVASTLHDLATQLRKSCGAVGKACSCGKHNGSSEDLHDEDELCRVIAPMMDLCIDNLLKMEYAERKDFEEVFSSLLKREQGGVCAQEEWLASDNSAKVLKTLVEDYADIESGFHVGCMLRACAKHAKLAVAFFENNLCIDVLHIAATAPFDLASDAFETLTSFLTEHKEVASRWMLRNFDLFFSDFHSMVLPETASYVTQRQALRVLRAVLLDPVYKNVMRTYVTRPEFMKKHMLLMLTTRNSARLQHEAFQTFKLFVANPNKPNLIVAYLVRNRQILENLVQNLQAPAGASDQEVDVLRQDCSALLRRFAQLPETLPDKIRPTHSFVSDTTASRSPAVSVASASDCASTHREAAIELEEGDEFFQL